MISNGNDVKKPPITRHRAHLSCVECRRKKLKCDRAAPCSACTRRDGGVSCTYQRSTTGFEAERDRRKRAEGRLEHLEQLVQQLSKSGQEHDGLTDGVRPPSTSFGMSSNARPMDEGSATGITSPGAAVYNGATHWSAMLEDIEELKSAIGVSMNGFEHIKHAFSIPETMDADDTAIFFGGGPTLTFEQILTECLPSRHDADRLIATYLRANAVKAPFLHRSQFQRQYLDFWASPLTAPALWVSILFSVFHAAATSLAPSVAPDRRYTIAAAHCLVTGKHYKPQQFAVEALVLYAQTKCFTQIDVGPDIGSILGTATRTAIRMGYHRDPDRLRLLPFDKEMRRRVWSALLQLELLISFQLGIPSSIQPGSHDAKLPSNLQDSDLNEYVDFMPTERPDNEETDITFYIIKHRLSAVFEKVHQHVSTTGGVNAYAQFRVEALDAEIRQTLLALPVQYRHKPVSDSAFDSPALIIARFCVTMIYEKCLCVLHRPYVSSGRRESLIACHVASSNIIQHFVDAYHEFQPGGQVEMQRWFMSAITWHDFLLGATALCLVLCSAARHKMLSDIDTAGSLTLLQDASGVLAKHSAQSRDTLQVAKVVRAVHERFSHLAVSSASTSLATAEQQSLSSGVRGTTVYPDAIPPIAATDLGWTGSFSQPMVDESWNWLERFLQDDPLAFGDTNPHAAS